MRYLTLLILILFSCSKSIDEDKLSLNESKWQSSKTVNYEFTLSIMCFCPVERTGPHIIKVVNDKIVTVNNLPYNPALTGELMTINQLFEFVKTSIAKNPFRNTIEYNSTYGYPQNVYFDFNQQIADEEIGYQITNFKPN